MAKIKSASMQFIMDELRKNKDISFADLRTKAEKKGLSIFPISFGRAQALLGIVKSAKRGEGKAALAKGAAAAAVAGGVDAPRRRGRPPGRSRTTALDPNAARRVAQAVDGLGSAVQGIIDERDTYFGALDQAFAIIKGALESRQPAAQPAPTQPHVVSTAPIMRSVTQPTDADVSATPFLPFNTAPQPVGEAQ